MWVDIGHLLGVGRRNFRAEGYERVASTAIATATVDRRTKHDKHLPFVVSQSRPLHQHCQVLHQPRTHKRIIKL